MGLLSPISIKDEATAIAGALQGWATARANGAEVKAVQSMAHLWEEVMAIATQIDASPRLLVVYNGENARGAFAQANTLHRVDRQWLVVVMRGHGFANALAANGERGEEPFYDVLESVREVLRQMGDISEEFPIDFKGIKPLPNLAPGRIANVFFDAYSIEFSTANDIPAVYTSPAPETESDVRVSPDGWIYIGEKLRYHLTEHYFQMIRSDGVTWATVTDTPEGMLFV